MFYPDFGYDSNEFYYSAILSFFCNRLLYSMDSYLGLSQKKSILLYFYFVLVISFISLGTTDLEF
ncbi:hypothetical protein LEP1GSC029_1805 [Leptospira interrogans str. 2002000626]|uniref:Uncharacterized protein n=1 Tax=Leptospira interrogans str. 2002000626 TaxID=996803 RepID=A0A829CXZ7_LEPIR|nr:hypothetical protein LEP1GSC029_1805 [Leptospira interrogans str. 2002000626]